MSVLVTASNVRHSRYSTIHVHVLLGMPLTLRFVAPERVQEVAGLREAADGEMGDGLSLSMASGGVILDHQPAMGVLPRFGFLRGEGGTGRAQGDGAAEVLL